MNVAQWEKEPQVETVEVSTLIREGTQLLLKGEAGKAEKLFAQVVEQEPSKPPHYYNLGRSLLTQNKIDDAERCFEQALSLNPTSHLGLYGMAQVAEARKQWDQAIEGYRNLIAMQPKRIAPIYQDLGSLLGSLKRWKEAIDCYQQLVEIDSANCDYYEALADALFASYRYPGAIKPYQKAIGLDPNRFKPHYKLGKTFFKLNKLDQAARSFKRALELDENLFEADELAAVVCETAGLSEQASIHWRRFLQKKPKSSLASLLQTSNGEPLLTSFKQRDIVQISTQKQSELAQENELLLRQLYQAQEELEVCFKQNKQQESQLSMWINFAETCRQQLGNMSKESRERM